MAGQAQLALGSLMKISPPRSHGQALGRVREPEVEGVEAPSFHIPAAPASMRKGRRLCRRTLPFSWVQGEGLGRELPPSLGRDGSVVAVGQGTGEVQQQALTPLLIHLPPPPAARGERRQR